MNGVLRAGRLRHTKPELEAGRRLGCRLLHMQKEGAGEDQVGSTECKAMSVSQRLVK